MEAAIIFWRMGIQEVPFGASEQSVLVAAGVLLTAVGVLAGILSHDAERLTTLRDQLDSQEQITKKSQDLIALIYQMTEALSGSGQQAGRLQRAALDFCLDGLEQLGARPTLVGAILLFGEAEGDKMALHVAAGRGIAPMEDEVTIPTTLGIIGRALGEAEPIFTDTPCDDPALTRFVTLQDCKSAYCVPMRAHYDNYGVMIVGSTSPDAFFAEEHVSFMRAIASQATVALQNASLTQSLVEERDTMIAAEVDARRQLADDLHAGPTQGIAAVAMRLNYVRRLMDKDPEKATAELYEIEQMARNTTKEIRHMLFTLRPIVIEAKGLKAGLDELVKQMKETYDQEIELYVQPGCDENLDPQASGTIFYIIEEAVNNARKHAQSEVIRVGVIVQGNALVVRVEDDGVGFDVQSTIAAAGVRSGHLGMVELQGRADLIDGKLQIDSAPGKGTRITLAAPLARIAKTDGNGSSQTGSN